MVIRNASILMDDFKFKKGDLCIAGDKISKINDDIVSGEDEEIDADGCYLIPGLIDSHTHGCKGYDTCDKDIKGYEEMSKFYASNGITSFMFTTMTLSIEELKEILKTLYQYISNGSKYAEPLGIYLEGPFINPKKKGAQSEKDILEPDENLFLDLQKVSGNNIKVVALAPEMKKGIDFVKKVSKDVITTIAHTDSDYETSIKAIEAGIKSITHAYNAMPSFLHRDPGVIGAAIDKDIFVELICDGIHVHPSMIRAMFKLVNRDKLILISDSMSAAGMENGKYMLGGQEVSLKDGKATLMDGTIAGSSTNILQCIRNCVEYGIKLEDAVKAATINPATRLGISDSIGSIREGKYADIVLIDKELNLKKVFKRGRKIF